MRKEITKGRYTATITTNSGGFLVIVTRDGDCLPGIPSRGYTTQVQAERGAERMLAKAAA